MGGLIETEFDVPQYRPPAPHPVLRQISQWNEIQPTTNKIVGRNPAAANVSSGVHYFYALYEQELRPNQNFAAQMRFLRQQYTILNDDNLIVGLLEGEP